MNTILLVIAAVIPPIVLMSLVYMKDKVEREPIGLVIKTIIFGMISVIPILIVEILFSSIFGMVIDLENNIIGMFIDAFFGVALVEEFFKMQACKLSVWKNKEFNYTFDGIVYAAASAIGFALVENVLYVLQNGMGNAVVRALTSIPGHLEDGIFMGIFLGLAKYFSVRGDKGTARMYKFLALLIPTCVHGMYDFLLFTGNTLCILIFFVFIIIVDIVALIIINKRQKDDRSIYPDPQPYNVMYDPMNPMAQNGNPLQQQNNGGFHNHDDFNF